MKLPPGAAKEGGLNGGNFCALPKEAGTPCDPVQPPAPHSPSWLERGKVKVDCLKGPSCRTPLRDPLCRDPVSSFGEGRWQNFPVALVGHQHSSRPMQRPPFRQGIWQKSTTAISR